MKKIAVHTLGCKVNQYDTEAMLESFERAGWESVSVDSGEANLYLVNTCTVTGTGDQKSVRLIRHLGREYPRADIIVADSGKRIDQDVEELFEPFARGDVARSGGGSGLGLSIAKTIVDMHGYQIGLVQPYGTFTKAFIVTCNRED